MTACLGPLSLCRVSCACGRVWRSIGDHRVRGGGGPDGAAQRRSQGGCTGHCGVTWMIMVIVPGWLKSEHEPHDATSAIRLCRAILGSGTYLKLSHESFNQAQSTPIALLHSTTRAPTRFGPCLPRLAPPQPPDAAADGLLLQLLDLEQVQRVQELRQRQLLAAAERDGVGMGEGGVGRMAYSVRFEGSGRPRDPCKALSQRASHRVMPVA